MQFSMVQIVFFPLVLLKQSADNTGAVILDHVATCCLCTFIFVKLSPGHASNYTQTEAWQELATDNSLGSSEYKITDHTFSGTFL